MSKVTNIKNFAKSKNDTSANGLEEFSDTNTTFYLENMDCDAINNIKLNECLAYCETKKEDCIMAKNLYNDLLQEIKELKSENKIKNARIDNTNKIIAIVGGLIGLVLTVFIFASNSQYNAIKDISNSNMQSIQTEIKAINQRLDYQEQLNELNIQNQVIKELKK